MTRARASRPDARRALASVFFLVFVIIKAEVGVALDEVELDGVEPHHLQRSCALVARDQIALIRVDVYVHVCVALRAYCGRHYTTLLWTVSPPFVGGAGNDPRARRTAP